MQANDQSSTAVARPQGIIHWAGDKFGVDAGKIMAVMRATCFKQGANDAPATDAEVAALLVVAKAHGLNPFLREIYAFKDSRKGIVPIVGVDGWSKLINAHENCDGIEFEYTYKDADRKAIESVTCIIHDKKKKYPTKITEFYDECYRDTAPWKSHPRRMLRHKALIQAGRVAFGFTGIFDEDEAERIVRGENLGALPGDGIDLAGGEFVPADRSRTDTLAADLAGRARNAADVVDVDTSTGKPQDRQPMSPETIIKTIESAEVEDEVHALLPHIQALPPSDQRNELMKKWNARVNSFKQVAEAGTDATVPEAFGGGAPQPPPPAAAPAAASPAPAKKKQADKPPAPAPAAAKPTLPTAAVKPAAGGPEAPPGPMDDDMKKVIDEMKEAKSPDQVDLIADRENKRGWSRAQRAMIYEAYTTAREKFNA